MQETGPLKPTGSDSKQQTFQHKHSLWERHPAEPWWVRTGGENPGSNICGLVLSAFGMLAWMMLAQLPLRPNCKTIRTISERLQSCFEAVKVFALCCQSTVAARVCQVQVSYVDTAVRALSKQPPHTHTLSIQTLKARINGHSGVIKPSPPLCRCMALRVNSASRTAHHPLPPPSSAPDGRHLRRLSQEDVLGTDLLHHPRARLIASFGRKPRHNPERCSYSYDRGYQQPQGL